MNLLRSVSLFEFIFSYSKSCGPTSLCSAKIKVIALELRGTCDSFQLHVKSI